MEADRLSDAAILTERLRGRTLRDLADSTGMSPEGGSPTGRQGGPADLREGGSA